MAEKAGPDASVAAAGPIAVGVFDSETLGNGLVALHRAGLGAHARLLDAARGDLDRQLDRAGIRLALTAGDRTADTKVLVIVAPGRSAAVAEALARAGARAVHLTARGGSANAPEADAPWIAPFPELDAKETGG